MQGRTRPELPTLDAGVQLLTVDDAGPRGTAGPLAALVVDHLLRTGGDACWVDSRGHARTDPLVRVAPSGRVLDRIRVARGFTAYQHVALVRRLAGRVDDDTALVVAPAIDARYREEVGRERGRRFLLRSLARLARAARDHGVPVLVTRSRADEFAAPVATAADATLACERTRFGPRFRTDGFETLVYPAGDGTVQTTLAFWRSVLAARHGDGVTAGERTGATAVDEPVTGREVTADGAY